MSKTCRRVENEMGDTPRWSCVVAVVVWREGQVEVRWESLSVGRWTKSSLVGVGTDAGCDVEA